MDWEKTNQKEILKTRVRTFQTKVRRQLPKNITLFVGVETIPLQHPIMSEGHTTPTAPALVGSSEDQTQNSPTGLEATGKDPKPSRSNTKGLDDNGKLVIKTGQQAGKDPNLPEEPGETDSDGDLGSEPAENLGKQEKKLLWEKMTKKKKTSMRETMKKMKMKMIPTTAYH